MIISDKNRASQKSDKAILYVHGKGGNHFEAERYSKICTDYDVIGVDYQDTMPWVVREIIKKYYDNLAKDYKEITLIANSIGAFFSMLALQNCNLKNALMISPIVDMEKLICDMMMWANVTEKELCEKGEIQTDFDETLSWKYLNYVRDNPIEWNVPTKILYGETDNLTSRTTIESFAKSHNASLTVMQNGEHWFHTPEQLAFLDSWVKKEI